jgi:hypothetical protein
MMQTWSPTHQLTRQTPTQIDPMQPSKQTKPTNATKHIKNNKTNKTNTPIHQYTNTPMKPVIALKLVTCRLTYVFA